MLAGLFLVASVADAQVTPAEIKAQADRIHDEAMALAGTSAHLPSAIDAVARKHAESASLRLVTDPRAVECNLVQASLMFQAGDYEGAQAYAEIAARIALVRGDAVAAAFALRDAALAAQADGRLADSWRLGQEASQLAMQPGLTRAERKLIQDHIRLTTSDQVTYRDW